MTKNLKAILIVIAVALITVVAGGLIIHFARGDKGGDEIKTDNTLTAKVDECILQESIAFCDEPNTVQPMSLATYAETANEQVVSGNSTTLTLKLTSNVLSEVMLEKINVPVTWGVDFVNADSAWASGKNISDYVTVTPKSDFTRTVTITNKAPFGEQIRLTATLDGDSSKTASCAIDYVWRIGSGFSYLDCMTDFGDDLSVGGTIQSTADDTGTVFGEISCYGASIDLESGFTSLLQSYLKFDVNFKSYSFSNNAIKVDLTHRSDYKYFSLWVNAANSQEQVIAADYSHFIGNWDSLTEAQKTAVKFAWWKAYQEYGDNANVDVTFDYSYGGKALGQISGYRASYISGECYGDGISVDGSLVNIVF